MEFYRRACGGNGGAGAGKAAGSGQSFPTPRPPLLMRAPPLLLLTLASPYAWRLLLPSFWPQVWEGAGAAGHAAVPRGSGAWRAAAGGHTPGGAGGAGPGGHQVRPAAPRPPAAQQVRRGRLARGGREEGRVGRGRGRGAAEWCERVRDAAAPRRVSKSRIRSCPWLRLSSAVRSGNGSRMSMQTG